MTYYHPVRDDLLNPLVHYNRFWFGGTVFLSKYVSPMPVYNVFLSYYNATENAEMLRRTKTLIDGIMSQHDGVVLVANMGGSFRNRTEFGASLKELLPYLNSVCKSTTHRNLVLWRETAAQHYDYHNFGYYGEDLNMIYIYMYMRDIWPVCLPHNSRFAHDYAYGSLVR
jgi:hypothetical protein